MVDLERRNLLDFLEGQRLLEVIDELAGNGRFGKAVEDLLRDGVDAVGGNHVINERLQHTAAADIDIVQRIVDLVLNDRPAERVRADVLVDHTVDVEHGAQVAVPKRVGGDRLRREV